MARWFYQTSLVGKWIPREAYRLATAYQLGMPVKRYSEITTNILHVFSGIAAISTGLFLMARLGSPLAIFCTCNQSEKSPNLASSFISAICTSCGGKHEDPGGYIYVYWLGLAVALILLALGLILIVHGFKELLRRSRTYECTKGFVVIEGTSKVITVMLWDQIASLQQGSIMRVGFRTANVSQTCFAVGKDGVWHEIAYTDLRKRIEQKLTQQS